MSLRLVAVAALLGGLGAGYLRFLRPRVLNWGATPDEISRTLPGDDVLAAVAIQTTRAVTVEAGPDAIWPWLVQMGPRPRAGVYTYDFVERMLGIDIENSDRILPEFQHLEPGEFFALNAKGDGLRVLSVQPNKHLVLQWEPGRSTWTFALCPAPDGTTRLLSRNRISGSGPAFWLGMLLAMEGGSLVMERKMLSGIKRRAERPAGSQGEIAAVAARP